MRQYLKFLNHILLNGTQKSDRTSTGTISTFGYQMRFDLNEGFPAVTTKKLHMKSVIHELLWFVSGETNIRPLVKNGVRIWNEWPYMQYKNSDAYMGESMKEFVEKIKKDPDFARRHGDLGPVYGKQWRAFEGKNKTVDQLAWVLEEMEKNPHSRRLIINSWNPPLIDDMALPPCHMMVQFYINDGTLSAQLYQRSGDAFLGIPFNIASYALLTLMMARHMNLNPGEFVHTIGDAHIYNNHIEQVKKQIERTPYPLPTMHINPEKTNLFDMVYEDFTLKNYNHHPHIKGTVSI